ncbi:MAG: class I SAM-dependent methyltransferase [Holosporaceae bacterium]|jgi:SAM-dependent methyltransferase|nr:class I SAM-dependent methyltransferase [Holosporaceae bacterium]
MPNAPDGWQDDLTDFHEEISNGNHPIDMASFDKALENIAQHSSALKDGRQILEIGCSSGLLLRRLLKTFPKAVVVGVDIIEKTLGKLSKILKQEGIFIPLLRFDITSCPLSENSYDVIVALNVLEHIKDHKRALQEIYRILKPGGIFVFEVPYGKELFDEYDRQLHHYRRYSDREIVQLLENAGLRKVYFSHLGFLLYPFFWCVKKWRSRRTGAQKPISNSRLSRNLIALSSGLIMRMIFQMELMLGRLVTYPYGIRCVGVFKKP